MTKIVVYSLRARRQLLDLYLWVAQQSGFPDRAQSFVAAIIDYCDGLAHFPLRGIARDDVPPGLRILGFRKRVTIAFAVHDRRVEVLGLYYGGQRVAELISDQTD